MELLQVILEALLNPIVLAPIIIFLVSRVPKPFGMILEQLIQVLAEMARKMLEERKKAIVQRAVYASEQMGGLGEEKKQRAMDISMRSDLWERHLWSSETELSERIEAEVLTLPQPLELIEG